MAVTVSYPDVYIEEIPSGMHTITGVVTPITAFVGWPPRVQPIPPLKPAEFLVIQIQQMAGQIGT